MIKITYFALFYIILTLYAFPATDDNEVILCKI